MIKTDLWDTDYKEHEEAYKKLPKSFQYFISCIQKKIQKAVEKKFPQAIPTSGFRCHKINQKYGGKSNSLHLFGLARDFYSLYPITQDKICPTLQVFKSKKNVYHVQLKRG